MGDKVDYFALLIGPPKQGKSSLAARLAERRLAAGSVVLVQDRNDEFGRFTVGYPSRADFLRALAEAGTDQRPVPLGASFATSADVVVALGVELGERWNRGRPVTQQPICLVINEATSFEASGATYISKELAAAIAERRHLGLELILCMQHAGQLPSNLAEYLTEVHLFRHTRRDAVDGAAKMLGLERGSLDGLFALPPHQYTSWRPLDGLV